MMVMAPGREVIPRNRPKKIYEIAAEEKNGKLTVDRLTTEMITDRLERLADPVKLSRRRTQERLHKRVDLDAADSGCNTNSNFNSNHTSNNNSNNNLGDGVGCGGMARPLCIPTLTGSTTIPTLPIPAVNRKHDRKVQLQKADRLLSRVKLIKKCEGQISNYFQKCRCKWCQHVQGARPCCWCTKHLADFNADLFPLKDDLVLLGLEGDSRDDDIDASDEEFAGGRLIKGVFPCQAVKNRIQEPADCKAGSRSALRKPSSGYGSLEPAVDSKIAIESSQDAVDEDEEDEGAPIYFTAEPRNGSNSSLDEIDNDEENEVVASTKTAEDFENEEVQRLVDSFEFVDLSDLYVSSESSSDSTQSNKTLACRCEVDHRFNGNHSTPSTTKASPTTLNKNNDNNNDRYRRSASAGALSSSKKSGSGCPRSQLPQQQQQQQQQPDPKQHSLSTTPNTSSSSAHLNKVPASSDCPSANCRLRNASRIPTDSANSLVNNRYAFNRSSGDRRKRFLLLGAEGVGKSALATQLSKGGFEPRHMPSFIDFVTVDEFQVDGTNFEVQLSDSKGYKEQLSLWPENFLSILDGILLVYSLDQAGSLDAAESLYRQLDSRGFHFVPKFLVANKSDILLSERKLTLEDGKQKANELNIPLVETTAIGHDAVVCMMRDIIRKCEETGAKASPGYNSADGKSPLTASSNQERTSWFARLKCRLQGRVNERTNN